MKELNEDIISLCLRNMEMDHPLMCASEPREGLSVCRAKEVPSFLSYFRTLSIGPAPGTEPRTFCAVVKRSTD